MNRHTLKKLIIINGPNLNLLGKREPILYGHQDFAAVFADLKTQFPEFELEYLQTNGEETMAEALHRAGETHEGVVLNPAAFTHTSIAVGDAVAAISIPVVEVHISNLAAREAFRQKSYVSKYAAGVIQGFGIESYRLALAYFSRF